MMGKLTGAKKNDLSPPRPRDRPDPAVACAHGCRAGHDSPPGNPTTAPTNLFDPPSDRWHFYGGLGFGAADGKYGDVLQKPFQWEVRIENQSPSGAWRWGLGLQFGSMDPADDPNIPPETLALWLPDEEWARLETSFSLTRVFRPSSTFRPYLQGRVGIERIHPRSAALLRAAPARGPRARRQPHQGHERHRLHHPARVRVVAQPEALPRRRLLLHLLQHRVVRHVPPRPARRRLRLRMGRARGPPLAALRRLPAGPAQDPVADEPGDRQAPSAPRRRTRTATRGACPAAGAGRRPRCSRSTGAPRCSTSTSATRTSTRSAPAASGPTSRKASPTTTTSSRRTS